MTKRVFYLVHDQARANAINEIKEARHGTCVEMKEPKRSNAQNAAIHAVITDWAKSLDWKYGGIDVDLDDLKVIAMSAYRKIQRGQNRFVIGLQGEPVDLQLKTSRLNKEEAAEFIDMVSAIASGVNV